MKILYYAANIVEAHMILHLLEQQRLSARIDGEFLQGAIGGLPAAGLVRVMVAEHDFDAGLALITQWEATQPAEVQPARPAQRPLPQIGLLVAAFLAGALCAASYYRAASPTREAGLGTSGGTTLQCPAH